MPFPWAAVLPTVIGGALGLAGGAVTNAANAREARKNRNFQERMSSTAHQREMRDLSAAGINPAVRGLGGASSPAGDRAEMEDVVGKGVSSGLAAREAASNIKLINAQAEQAKAGASHARAQAYDIMQTWDVGGKLDRLTSERDSAFFRAEMDQLNADQLRKMLPIMLKKAEAEVDSLASSSRAAKARATLDEIRKTGELNIQEFEKNLGTGSPVLRNLMMLLRALR